MSVDHETYSRSLDEDDSDGTPPGTLTPRATQQAGSSSTKWYDNYAQAFIAAIAEDVSTFLAKKYSEQEKEAVLTKLNDKITEVETLIAANTEDLDTAIIFSVDAISSGQDSNEEGDEEVEFYTKYKKAGSTVELVLPTVTCYIDVEQSEDGSEAFVDVNFLVD